MERGVEVPLKMTGLFRVLPGVEIRLARADPYSGLVSSLITMPVQSLTSFLSASALSLHLYLGA